MCTKLVHMYTKLVLNSYHIDTELVPDWCQFSDENSSKLWQSIKQSIKTLANIGSTCVPNWYHNRTRLIPDWYRIDSTCAQHWYQIRTRLVLHLYQIGTRFVPDWYQIRTRLVPYSYHIDDRFIPDWYLCVHRDLRVHHILRSLNRRPLYSFRHI